MKAPFKKALLEKIEFLLSISNIKKSELVESINAVFESSIGIFSDILKKQPVLSQRTISFGKVKEDFGVDFGLNRTREKVVIAKWILDLQPKTRNYLLSFLIIKECLLHFLLKDVGEIDEAIINIVTILLLVELFEITTIDNPILSAIRSKIYSEEIAELSHYYWDNLLLLLIRNNIHFLNVLKKFFEIIEKDLNSSLDKIKLFSEWIFSKTVKEGDSILPFYTNSKLIELIETLFELGYEKGTTSFIAHKLKLSQKTITKRFKALNESYFSYWRSDINYEKINLHNYLFKIIVNKGAIYEKLIRDLLNIPYLKSLFQGTDSNSKILYSPTLVCPHIISDQLDERLRKMKNKGLIKDYSLQLVRERYRNFAITNSPYNPTISTFKKLINQKDSLLRKYTFYKYKRGSMIPSKGKPINLDYNLLYFLSVIDLKFLLRARYGVLLNEFKKFYMENNIPITDVNAQTNLLYQNELRAKNRGLLSFSLYMRNLMKRSPDVLIFEIPTSNGFSDVEFKEIIRKLSVFSLLGQNTLYDRHIFNIPGVAHTHPIRDVIQEFLDKEGLTSSFFTIKLHKSKFVPLQDLFDYEENKWKITNI